MDEVDDDPAPYIDCILDNGFSEYFIDTSQPWLTTRTDNEDDFDCPDDNPLLVSSVRPMIVRNGTLKILIDL